MYGDGGASGIGDDGKPGLWEKFWLPLINKILGRKSK